LIETQENDHGGNNNQFYLNLNWFLFLAWFVVWWYGLGKTAPGRGLPFPREYYLFTVAVIEEGVDNFEVFANFASVSFPSPSVSMCLSHLPFFASRIEESTLFCCLNFIDMGFFVFEPFLWVDRQSAKISVSLKNF
jgi:hypothetical protein